MRSLNATNSSWSLWCKRRRIVAFQAECFPCTDAIVGFGLGDWMQFLVLLTFYFSRFMWVRYVVRTDDCTYVFRLILFSVQYLAKVVKALAFCEIFPTEYQWYTSCIFLTHRSNPEYYTETSNMTSTPQQITKEKIRELLSEIETFMFDCDGKSQFTKFVLISRNEIECYKYRNYNRNWYNNKGYIY